MAIGGGEAYRALSGAGKMFNRAAAAYVKVSKQRLMQTASKTYNTCHAKFNTGQQFASRIGNNLKQMDRKDLIQAGIQLKHVLMNDAPEALKEGLSEDTVAQLKELLGEEGMEFLEEFRGKGKEMLTEVKDELGKTLWQEQIQDEDEQKLTPAVRGLMLAMIAIGEGEQKQLKEGAEGLASAARKGFETGTEVAKHALESAPDITKHEGEALAAGFQAARQGLGLLAGILAAQDVYHQQTPHLENNAERTGEGHRLDNAFTNETTALRHMEVD